MKIPDTINAIIQQCGGIGLRGAFTYVGAERPFMMKCAQPEGEYRSSYPSNQTPQGLVDYDVGLTFRVNGKPRERWHMMIAYEPDDTYTVWLWRIANPTERKQGLGGVVLDHREDVYAEELQSVVEQMYDSAMKAHNGGFIPC